MLPFCLPIVKRLFILFLVCRLPCLVKYWLVHPVYQVSNASFTNVIWTNLQIYFWNNFEKSHMLTESKKKRFTWITLSTSLKKKYIFAWRIIQLQKTPSIKRIWRCFCLHLLYETLCRHFKKYWSVDIQSVNCYMHTINWITQLT